MLQTSGRFQGRLIRDEDRCPLTNMTELGEKPAIHQNRTAFKRSSISTPGNRQLLKNRFFLGRNSVFLKFVKNPQSWWPRLRYKGPEIKIPV